MQGTQDGCDVLDAFLFRAGPQHDQHFRLDVDGQDPAGRPDQLGQRQAVEAVAAAHVADGHARADAEVGQQQGAALFPLTHVADQPLGARVVHGLGDLPPEILLARRRHCAVPCACTCCLRHVPAGDVDDSARLHTCISTHQRHTTTQEPASVPPSESCRQLLRIRA